MRIRFADSRPSGDFALVLPVSGKNRIALDSLGADRTAVDAALKSQRFEGDSGSAAELFIPAGTGGATAVGQSGIQPDQKQGRAACAALPRFRCRGTGSGLTIDVSRLLDLRPML